MKKDHKRIRKQRAKVHGPIKGNLENLGLSLTALLQDHYNIQLPYPIPAHVAGLMLAQGKLLRCVKPYKYSKDDYDDLRNYTDFGQELDPARKKGEK